MNYQLFKYNIWGSKFLGPCCIRLHYRKAVYSHKYHGRNK